jgi:hypothetical protein
MARAHPALVAQHVCLSIVAPRKWPGRRSRYMPDNASGMGRKKAKCAYCGAAATTADHVPPKGLFAKPLPKDLVTVPSCRPCNGDAAPDDEYFRTVMVLRWDVYERSDAAGAVQRAMRALVRPRGEGFRNGLLNKLTEIPVFGDDGAKVGSIRQLDVDMRRVRRVVERIVRGLYYHHKGVRLPPECRVTVNSLESFESLDVDGVTTLSDLTRWAMSAERHVSPQGVLDYRFRESVQDPVCAVWILGFYDLVPFVVVTAREHPGA